MKPLFSSLACILSLAALSAAPLHAQATPTKDIVDTAVTAGSFKTLTAALTAAGLVEALKDEGPLTVFAPTDEAFEKLPAGTVENLLKPENKAKLTEILTYHVVAGEIPLSKALELSETKTLQGSTVSVLFEQGSIKIGTSTLANADIKTTNGVIHVIDSVLIPSASKKCAPSYGKCSPSYAKRASSYGKCAPSSEKSPQAGVGEAPASCGEIIIKNVDDLKKLIELSKILGLEVVE